VQLLSTCPPVSPGEYRTPLTADEFSAMVTAMCGRYGAMRQQIEQMADDELRALRSLLNAARDRS
jgi:hypothetical protein